MINNVNTHVLPNSIEIQHFRNVNRKKKYVGICYITGQNNIVNFIVNHGNALHDIMAEILKGKFSNE
jgi:hypothetical protein